MTIPTPDLFKCPKTGWTVPAVADDDPFEVKGRWFVWTSCCACDWDEHPRTDPAFNPAHPGPHLLVVETTEARP